MQALDLLDQAGQVVLGWLGYPAGWSQFALLAIAYLLARVVAGRLSAALTKMLAPKSALGLLGEITVALAQTRVELGSIRLSALSLIKGLIAGALFFWLESWSKRQSASHIKAKQELRPATGELPVMASEIVIFVVEYWVNGTDDGRNKYRSHVLFAIWNALKAEYIEMPFPQRGVHFRQAFST